MPQVYDFALQGLQPAFDPRAAVARAVNLPRGGPTGTGVAYAEGLGLGLVAGAAQPEIWTIDTTGNSGTFTLLFVGGGRVYSSGAVAYNVALADLKAALELIFGDGSIATVTGTPGTQYVVTFADDQRVGGYPFFAATFDSTLIAVTRTQRGCSGAGQYDVYDGSTVTTIDALNQYEVALDPTGALVGEYLTATGQPFSPPAFVQGYFNYADIPNVATAAVGNDKKLGYYTGSASATDGAILYLSQKT